MHLQPLGHLSLHANDSAIFEISSDSKLPQSFGYFYKQGFGFAVRADRSVSAETDMTCQPNRLCRSIPRESGKRAAAGLLTTPFRIDMFAPVIELDPSFSGSLERTAIEQGKNHRVSKPAALIDTFVAESYGGSHDAIIE